MTAAARPAVFVCAECPGGAERLAMVRDALAGSGWRIDAAPCLSGCRSGGSVAIRAPGKMAYLFGPVGPEDRPGLAAFAALYDAAAEGVIDDARPLGDLRLKALARIPAT